MTRALDLDPDLAEAHTALGLVRFYFEWDWSGAEVEFRRALELNPGSQAVHEEYGNFLDAMGRLDEGLARSREAARLDPLSLGPAHNIAINAMIRGDYELAAAGFRHTIDIDPNWTWGYIKLARTLALQNDCKEAFAQAEIAERRIAGGAAPLSWSWLGVTYATCGDTARARDKLDQLHALEKKQYVDPVTFAEIHCALGEVDEALGWYEKAFTDRTPNMVYAAILPRLGPSACWQSALRGDHRSHGLSAIGQIGAMGNWRSPSRRGRRSEGAPLAGGKRHLRTDERDMAKHLGLPVTQDRCCTSDVERLVWQGSLAAMGRIGPVAPAPLSGRYCRRADHL